MHDINKSNFFKRIHKKMSLKMYSLLVLNLLLIKFYMINLCFFFNTTLYLTKMLQKVANQVGA